MDDTADPAVFRHHGLLGTVVELRVTAADEEEAELVDGVVIAEIERLVAVLSARDERSELRRWARGEVTEPSSELAAVLASAEEWTRRSGGAFDPRVGRAVDVWSRAAADGRVPDADELGRAVEGTPDAPPGIVDLSAIAKGWIVDRAVALGGSQTGVGSLTVNAGGDLRHVGGGSIVVGIEDPHRPYDNAPPLVAVRLGQGALATSGGARRGWRIDGRWYPHVLDPRTGRPVDRVASASVLAPDAATADVVATVLTVAEIDEGLAFVEGLEGVEALVVARDGTVSRSPGWAASEVRAAC